MSGKEFSVVEVPEFLFAMVDGQGNPNTSPDYARAVEALYSVSYAAKLVSKGELGRDYVVGRPADGNVHQPVEGRVVADDDDPPAGLDHA